MWTAVAGIGLASFFAGWFLAKLDERAGPREGVNPSAPANLKPPKPVAIPPKRQRVAGETSSER